MADLVPWDEMATVFLRSMSVAEGRPSVDLRTVLGTLLVKQIENLSDERTIEYIQENIYAQYFVGLSSFQAEPVFVPHLFVTIPKRLGEQSSKAVNDMLIAQAHQLKVIKHRTRPNDQLLPPPLPKQEAQQPNEEDDKVVEASAEVEDTKPLSPPPRNRGTLIVDATVAPVGIAYSTYYRLLAECRRITEGLIDALYTPQRSLWPTKPRTYRREAKRREINFSKKRRKTKREIRRQVKKQAAYVARNARTLHQMLDRLESEGKRENWTHAQRRQFWIVQEVLRQQRAMLRDGRRRIDDRIVSVVQPHIRPIKRGTRKGGEGPLFEVMKNTEFGPKINAGLTEGFVRADQIAFNAFNESEGLIDQVEGCRACFGYYPGRVLADKIYWTHANRKWLRAKNIDIGGVSLGRKRSPTKY